MKEFRDVTVSVCFQWQRCRKCIVYVLYRWIIAIFFAFSFINSVLFSVANKKAEFIVIYLTRWNLFGTMIACVMGACLVTCDYYNPLESTGRARKLLKFYWFLSNNSVVFACVVSTIYWTMLYHPKHESLNNYLVHATNWKLTALFS